MMTAISAEQVGRPFQNRRGANEKKHLILIRPLGLPEEVIEVYATDIGEAGRKAGKEFHERFVAMGLAGNGGKSVPYKKLEEREKEKLRN